MAGNESPRVIVVGGGLAGLAAAAALVTRGFRVKLLEARRRLGGRAGSYVDRETGELVDHCQHVAMGCCTNFLDLCRRAGAEPLFERYETLHFFSPEGERCDFAPSQWLPAPLHLATALRGLRFLSPASQRALSRGILRLARMAPPERSAAEPTVAEWLAEQRQPAEAVELFWQVVLVSALGDTLDRVSVSSARKVFVDGFLAAREASQILVPRVSLGELYDQHLAGWLRGAGAEVVTEAPVEQIGERGRVTLADGREETADFVVLATTWRRAGQLLGPEIRRALPQLDRVAEIVPSPITGVHLWFDRPLTDLPHAVIVGRLSQWVFSRPARSERSDDGSHYYQVVISGSHELSGRSKQSVVEEVLDDLRTIWPAARDAVLMRSKIITEPESVFSMRPGLDALRPAQRTAVPGLLLAGDWTATGWPATMEGAVRSGYLAAEAILAEVGRPERVLVADLPRSWLAKLLVRR